ncbi:hypothetical protein AVEN_20009-1 [Araneus ventricosus]|uniref:Uncharacterized protein n=1 Tax=Araneus ventricosus TaxID=182803 RepID=A0A4Y2TMA2_ARAVE|nr:hypothetical protein AVEN_20009-1 [Araneus ventricosus]
MQSSIAGLSTSSKVSFFKTFFNSSAKDCVTYENWLKLLAYLADIFSAFNVLNLTLQDKDVNKSFVQDKVEAMIIKLQRWAKKEGKIGFDAFPALNDFLETNESKLIRQQQ